MTTGDALVLDGSLMSVLGDGQRVSFSAADKRARLRFEPRADFLDGQFVQAGLVSAWIDCAMAHACRLLWKDEYRPATLEMKIAMLQPVALTTVFADGWLVREESGFAFVEGQLTSSDEQVLASATATVKKVQPRG